MWWTYIAKRNKASRDAAFEPLRNNGKFSEDDDESMSRQPHPSPWLRRNRPLVAHGALCICTAVLLAAHLLIVSYHPIWIRSRVRSASDEISWSPILDLVSPQSTRFNESFLFPSRFPSQFQGSLDDDLDQQWEQFTMHPMLDGRSGVMTVGEADFRQATQGWDAELAETVVKVVDGDEQRYVATLDVFHVTHCLNMLRKAVHPERYGPFQPSKQGHYDHCIETIRQVLMCNSGTGLVFFHWVKGVAAPWPNYNTEHRCRNPDAILRWALSNAVAIKQPLTAPSGASELLENPF